MSGSSISVGPGRLAERTNRWLGLLALWAGYVIFSAAVWAQWGRTGFPVGSFWWDELALSGAAAAVNGGLVPAVDFWAPFIAPIYIKAFAMRVAGLSGGHVLECLLLGALVLVLFSWLTWGRAIKGWMLGLGALLILQTALPFNPGTIANAALGTVTFSGGYNRLGAGLIGLVLLSLSMWPASPPGGRLVVWTAMVFALSLLVKVTAFQVAVTCCGLYAVLCSDKAGRRLALKAFMLSLLMLWAYFEFSGTGPGYFSALHDLSAVRMDLMRERLWQVQMTLMEHLLELVALVMCAALVAWRGVLLGGRWVGPVSWYLLSCAALALYTVTNFGDNGLLPTLCVVYALLHTPSVCANGPSNGEADRVGRLLYGVCVSMLFAGLLGHLGIFYRWSDALVRQQRAARWVHLPVETRALADNFLIEEGQWLSRRPIHVPGVPTPLRVPATYASYVEGLDEGVQFLRAHFPDRSKSVYALDFPSFVFSTYGGYRFPRHAYPWMLYGHELSADVHPEADQLLSDVDILMVARCSLSEGNRRMFAAIYRGALQRQWQVIGHVRCWDVYVRQD
jgi:hypothetical protein